MIFTRRSFGFLLGLLLVVVCGARYAPAQTPPPSVQTPRPSQKASVMQRIGVTDLTITYSRPAVKGRTIWGDWPAGASQGEATLDDQTIRPKDQPIVPYGHVWRTGANEATQFVVTDEVLVNGQKLPGGSYSLHTIPGKDEWSIVFNGTANQWGSFNYDPKKDTLRVKAKPQTTTENQEWLLYSIPEVTPNSAKVVIRWEKIAVPFIVEVPNVEAVWRAKADALIAANPTEWRLPLQVGAAYANENKFDEALKWVDQSIKIKETYQNLATKANVLINSGKKEEGIAVAEQALARGKADKVDTSRLEKRLADLKAGKP